MDIKGFNGITVNDIAEVAVINRSTFYLHYTDKYDLLQRVTDEAIQNIMQLVAPEAHIIDGKLEYDSFVENINFILKAIEGDALLYKEIINDKEMLGIKLKFENALRNKLDICFTGQILISRELFLELITSLYISVIRWWLNNDMKYAPSFMAKELVRFLTVGPCNVVGVVMD